MELKINGVCQSIYNYCNAQYNTSNNDKYDIGNFYRSRRGDLGHMTLYIKSDVAIGQSISYLLQGNKLIHVNCACKDFL